MIQKHLEQFFKDTCILSPMFYQYGVQHNKSCTAYNRWTSPSHCGDHFCVGITFAVVQGLQFMSDMTFDCFHQKRKTHRDQIKIYNRYTSPFRMYFGMYLLLVFPVIKPGR